MRDIDPLLVERAGDEERPVAVERLLLRAHERDPVPRGTIHDTVQSAPERFRRRDAIVVDTSLLVASRVVRTAAQLVAQIHIPNPLRLQGLDQRLTVELGIESAVRRRSDIGHRAHSVPAQQPGEHLERVGGVADGEHGAKDIVHGCYLRSDVTTAATSL